MNFIMPTGTRELFERMRDRRERKVAALKRRVEYGGKKGRSAARKLRRLGENPFAEPERVIATLYGPEWAKAPYGFAR
jgi:hypothetical protein